MLKKVKYGKIAVVISITLLVWVWADLAKTEEFSVSSATIVAKSTNPGLWVSFSDESSASIARINFKGPTSKIAKVQGQLNDGSLVPEFFLDPEQQGLTEAGEYTLDVPTFLKKSKKIKELGLTVESCDPNTLSVNVVELVKKRLDVKCSDEDRNLIRGAIIEPAQVDIFVPRDWVGDAKVQLTRREIEQARTQTMEKTPYVELAADQIKKADITVKITTPPQEDTLPSHPIKAATLGITLSQILQGEYDVEVENLPEVIGGITIRATSEAKRAYEQMRYQVILEIYDDDAMSTEPLKRKLIYNFPAEYVRKGEIELKNPDQPAEAKFKLIRLPSAVAPSNE